MGQQDILDFLKENKGRWFDRNCIAKATGVETSSAGIVLKKLRNQGAIKWKRVKEGSVQPFYYRL